MPARKASRSGKSKKGEAQQKQQGEQEKGEIPSVPKSPDSGTPTIKSEGACGQSSTTEDGERLEESQYDDSEEANGADSKQASEGRKMSWMEKRRLKMQAKREKFKQGKVDKERKESQQEEEDQREQNRSASHSKHSGKRSSQHAPPLSEAPLPQGHHTPSESSQGSHSHASSQDTTIEEGAKQPSPEAQGDQPASDDGTTCSEEKDFQSVSETSFWKEEESTLSDMERMILLQRASTAEEGAKKAETHLQRLSEEKVALQDKLETMNKQFQKLEQWHKLMIDDAKQTSEATPGVPQEETVVVNRKKHKQLKSSFILLTEKNMKMEVSHRQLLEKLEDRDKQIKELQSNARDDSIVPNVYKSLSSEKVAELTEELSHDEALRGIQKQNATISELRKLVASLQTKMGTFEKTAAENSRMEQHGKEQSKVVMEWRQKYEATEADKAELTMKCVAQEHICEHLKQENQHLVQKLQKLEGEHNRLVAVYGTVTQQLSQLHKCLGEVDAMKKQAAAISEAMTAKAIEASDLKDEKDSLQTMLDEIAEELERQKIQAETYKEDFENERKDREAQASAYEDEKAAMHLQHQQIIDDLKQQTEELKHQIEDLKIKVEIKETTMKGQCEKLEKQIQNLNGELRRVEEQSEQDKDALQVALAKNQCLKETHSKLDDKCREKEAHLEKALFHKSDLEDQLQKSRADHDRYVDQQENQLQQLYFESTELQQQIARANDEIAAWKGDCQAKTQQVKQYSKQVDQFRVQVDGLTAGLRDSRAKVAEYEYQLGYYQKQIKHLEEDNEQKDVLMKAQFEAEMLDIKSDLERLKGEKIMWEMMKQAGDQRRAASTCDEQQLNSESTTNDDIGAWRGNYQAIIQVDDLRAELRDSRTKNAEYTQQLEYYQEQIRQKQEEYQQLLTEHQQSQHELQQHQQEYEQEQQRSQERVEYAEVRAEKAERELREVQTHSVWIIPRGEIELSEEELGRGSWGKVKVAKFRETRVAAKCYYKVLVSDYNLRLFHREISMAARLRHPNLVQFIGASMEGKLILVTELMTISLGDILHRGPLSEHNITSISLDVARALNYLHMMQPLPIIHRDICSGNVLLDPLPEDCWKAKVSDYGSVNLLQHLTTVHPGNPFYAAPESEYPRLQTAKMDIYSFGVLLAEMLTNELPEKKDRHEQILKISVERPTFIKLVRQCLNEESVHRPSAQEIIITFLQF